MNITNLGDVAVMTPVAALITAWLVISHSFKNAVLWCLLIAAGMGLVIASKMAFVGWGIGIASLDFTGFSGHSMLATAIIPVLFYLILQKASPAVRLSGIVVGILCGIMIGISRLVLEAHSVSEAVSGCALGAAVSLSFIWLLEPSEKPVPNRPLIALSLMVLLAAPYIKPTPTQDWISNFVIYLSGNKKSLFQRKNAFGELSNYHVNRASLIFLYSSGG